MYARLKTAGLLQILIAARRSTNSFPIAPSGFITTPRPGVADAGSKLTMTVDVLMVSRRKSALLSRPPCEAAARPLFAAGRVPRDRSCPGE